MGRQGKQSGCLSKQTHVAMGRPPGGRVPLKTAISTRRRSLGKRVACHVYLLVAEVALFLAASDCLLSGPVGFMVCRNSGSPLDVLSWRGSIELTFPFVNPDIVDLMGNGLCARQPASAPPVWGPASLVLIPGRWR